MRILLLEVLLATLASAQSFPRAWTFIDPKANSILGIEWGHLRGSFLADAVAPELADGGQLGFPDLACLRDAREVLLAGPDLLGVISGSFPASTVAEQAISAGMRPVDYDGFRLWIAADSKHGRSLAQISGTVVLIGWRDTLQAAIDRSLATAGHQYSPLLSRGARLASNFDLWIAATALPDPLVSVFLPIALESGDFDAGLNTRAGLLLDARYSMASAEDAGLSADYFREAIPTFHPLLGALNVIEDGESVRLKLQITAAELAEQLRPPQPPNAAIALPVPAKPPRVQVFGLDSGPRELPLSPQMKR